MALVLNGTTGASMVQDDAVNPVTDIASGIPCFSAYRSGNQAITQNTYTKIQFNGIIFDTTNAYDETTNYRFQPLVAGYYMCSASAQVISASNATNGINALLNFSKTEYSKQNVVLICLLVELTPVLI